MQAVSNIEEPRVVFGILYQQTTMHLPDRGVKGMGEENLVSQRGPTQGMALLFLTVAGNGLSLIDQFSYLIFSALTHNK